MITENQEYLAELREWADRYQDWDLLQDQTIMVAGATGMIGSTLIDWLLLLNQEKQLNCKVIALGRNKQKAQARFASYWEQAGFTFVEGDINQGDRKSTRLNSSHP